MGKVSTFGSWVLDIWILAFSYWALDIWVSAFSSTFGFWALDIWVRLSVLGLWIYGFDFRLGFGYMVLTFGSLSIRYIGLAFSSWVLNIRVRPLILGHWIRILAFSSWALDVWVTDSLDLWICKKFDGRFFEVFGYGIRLFYFFNFVRTSTYNMDGILDCLDEWMAKLDSTKLEQRRQQNGEDVNTYAAALQELYRRVETNAFAYPEAIKARKFVNGLLPNLYVTVKSHNNQTWNAAVDRAKAYELTHQDQHAVNAYLNKFAPAGTSTQTEDLYKAIQDLTR
ncbi:hypothetical protein RhiirC2_794764 [Rhizophagus irregularis]|uniref:Retrotransposon gag domain-containing protein n=1 Tax=Rhizophagus irregularis TaxID=588596 RepID=A0A2N1MCX4_9GLOM|nr:hypothetical protein RhiirC2_794764 [Rhizophagus irregularis]